MSYTLANFVPVNPATGAIVGQVVNAWDAGPANARFGTPPVVPATNGSPPSGSPDYGPYTTGATSADGGWAFTVSTPDEWIISTYDPADTSNGGSYNTYWLGPYLINPSTNEENWTSYNVYTTRKLVATGITSGSYGAALPVTTLNVTSTTNFPASGTLFVLNNAFAYTVVTYTGTSGGNTFTGCSGGTGTLPSTTGTTQVVPCYLASNYRRQVALGGQVNAAASGDSALVSALVTVGGSVTTPQVVGIDSAPGAIQLSFSLNFPVHPNTYYAVSPSTSNTGTVTATAVWTEVDF